MESSQVRIEQVKLSNRLHSLLSAVCTLLSVPYILYLTFLPYLPPAIVGLRPILASAL